MRPKKILSVVVNLFVRPLITFYRVGVPLLNRLDTEYVVWAPDFWSLKFFHGDNLQKVLAAYHYLKVNGRTVSVYTRLDVGKFNGKKIIYFGSKKYNVFGFENYVHVFEHLAEQLERQGNIVFPKKDEVRLWENKAYMHDVFDRLNIRTPKSLVVNLKDDSLVGAGEFSYPVLVKESHSCSSLGLYKVSDAHEMKVCLAGLKEEGVGNVIVQELLDIRRDFRIIFVGEKIVLHYWRINHSSEWKPTSTGRGSSVDFCSFPERWREWLYSQFKKLEINTGAFDVAWDRDDLEREPYVLEVSPFYQPNPRTDNPARLRAYGDWKKSLNPFGGYQSAMIDIIFSIQKEYVDLIIKK